MDSYQQVTSLRRVTSLPQHVLSYGSYSPEVRAGMERASWALTPTKKVRMGCTNLQNVTEQNHFYGLNFFKKQVM